MKLKFYIALPLFVFALGETSYAQPDVKYKSEVKGLTLYRDALKEDLYYYISSGLKIATDMDGKPDFKFLLMRYTGTHVNGDQGSKRFKSLLSMKINNESPSLSIINEVKETLTTQNHLTKVELRPMPIQNLHAILVYSSINSEGTPQTNVHDKGFFEEPATVQKGAFWKERNFVVRLDEFTAQIFWNAFSNQQSVLSVGYAFSAKVKSHGVSKPEFTGDPDLVKEMENNFLPAIDTLQNDSLTLQIVSAGTLDVTVDTERWPDLLKKVDLNEQAPTEYAILETYCYDFNNGIRSDLYAKKLEIEAQGVSDRIVRQSYTFKNLLPDVYAATIFFPYAVRLDMPYKFRITEIDFNGNVSPGSWVEREDWSEILDITSHPKEETEVLNNNGEE